MKLKDVYHQYFNSCRTPELEFLINYLFDQLDKNNFLSFQPANITKASTKRDGTNFSRRLIWLIKELEQKQADIEERLAASGHSQILVVEQSAKNNPYTASLKPLPQQSVMTSDPDSIAFTRQDHAITSWAKRMVDGRTYTARSLWLSAYGLPLWLLLLTAFPAFILVFILEFEQRLPWMIATFVLAALFAAVFVSAFGLPWLKSVFTIISRQEKAYGCYPLMWLPAPQNVPTDNLFLRTERQADGYIISPISYSAPCPICTADQSTVRVSNQQLKKAKKHLGRCSNGHAFSFDFGSLEGKREPDYDFTPA